MKKRKINWPLLIFMAVLAVLIIVRTFVEANGHSFSSGQFWEETAWNLVGLIFLVIAAIILQENKKNAIGWVLLGPPVAAAFDSTGTLVYGAVSDFPDVLSFGQSFFVLFSGIGWVLLIVPIFLISIIFPDGKLPGKLQRFALWIVGITFSLFLLFAFFYQKLENIDVPGQFWPNPIGFIPQAYGDAFIAVFPVLLILTTVTCLASIVDRYRRSRGIERAQMKWLFYAMSIFLIFYLILALIVDPADEGFGILLNLVFILTIMLIPISIGIAIMRYRLWDIDLLINRSLVYGLLTAVIAAIWAGSLTVTDQLISSLVGEESKAASTVLSTLLAASIIQPAREFLERWINKRFFPEKEQLEKAFTDMEPRFWPLLDETKIGKFAVERVCEIMEAPQGIFFKHIAQGDFEIIASHGNPKGTETNFKLSNKQIKSLREEKAISMSEGGDVSLIIPLFFPRVATNELFGLLGISLRQNGRGYSKDEVQELIKLGGKLGEALYGTQMKKLY